MKECPRCHKLTMRDDMLLCSRSRRDGRTYICKDCGDEEAEIDLGVLKPSNAELEFVRTHNRFSGR